jgi:peptidoglycan/LPS O-acetylase OafA/YrhL
MVLQSSRSQESWAPRLEGIEACPNRNALTATIPSTLPANLEQISSPRRSAFRPDIEGLRAVAILLVVCFHSGLSWVRGGFVGVDVFFVLSGYLITELLVDEVERTGRLDFARFYARRIRRLLPAALLMLVCTLIVSFAVLSPIETARVSKSAIATATYVSNAWFVLQSTDYFSANVDTNPLLHTWSLAVEEQFYLVWPLLVLFCMRWKKPRKTIVVVFSAVTILSFAAGVWLTRALPPFAFFGTPTRAWEFAAGGLATLLQDSPALRVFRHAAAWLGAALLLLSGAWLTSARGYPGVFALMPVMGTVMILIAGKLTPSQTGLFTVLGSRLFQTLGGLSYSWYLWHWPVLVFGRILLPGRRSPLTSILLLLASLVVAWGTHSLIENPVRFSRRLAARPALSLALGATLTIGGLIAGAVSLSFGQRLASSPGETVFAAASDDRLEHDCLTGFRRDQPRICSFGPSDAKTVVLFGDSHAEQWLPALVEIANKEPWHVVTLLKAACPSAVVPVYNPRLEREEYECSTWRTKALSYISTIRPSIVLISNSSGYVKLNSVQDPYAQLPIEKWRDGTRSALRSLNDAAAFVVLLRDTPRPDIDVPVCLSRVHTHPLLFSANTCYVPEERALAQSVWQAEISAAQNLEHVSILDLTDNFCDSRQCPAMLNGMVVYRDGNHITSTFAASLAPILADELSLMQKTQPGVPQPVVAASSPAFH